MLVSAPGVLSPGPLFFVNIIYGSKMGITAGIKIAYHTMVELPLIIILELMPQKVDNKLAYAGFSNKKGPILLGAMLSALNPFFLIWWFTIGLKLINDSIHFFGLVNGILILFSSHIWMDYAWLITTSYLIYRGTSVLKTILYCLFQ